MLYRIAATIGVLTCASLAQAGDGADETQQWLQAAKQAVCAPNPNHPSALCRLTVADGQHQLRVWQAPQAALLSEDALLTLTPTGDKPTAPEIWLHRAGQYKQIPANNLKGQVDECIVHRVQQLELQWACVTRTQSKVEPLRLEQAVFGTWGQSKTGQLSLRVLASGKGGHGFDVSDMALAMDELCASSNPKSKGSAARIELVRTDQGLAIDEVFHKPHSTDVGACLVDAAELTKLLLQLAVQPSARLDPDTESRGQELLSRFGKRAEMSIARYRHLLKGNQVLDQHLEPVGRQADEARITSAYTPSRLKRASELSLAQAEAALEARKQRERDEDAKLDQWPRLPACVGATADHQLRNGCGKPILVKYCWDVSSQRDLAWEDLQLDCALGRSALADLPEKATPVQLTKVPFVRVWSDPPQPTLRVLKACSRRKYPIDCPS